MIPEIIALENNQIKMVFFCLPDKNLTETFGKFSVRTLNETSSQDYTLREFVVAKEGNPEDRKIYHFHFQVFFIHTLLLCVLRFRYPPGIGYDWLSVYY